MIKFTPNTDHTDITNLIASYLNSESLAIVKCLFPQIINPQRIAIMQESRCEDAIYNIINIITPKYYVSQHDKIMVILHTKKLSVYEVFLEVDRLLDNENPTYPLISLYCQLLNIMVDSDSIELSVAQFIKISRRYINILNDPQSGDGDFLVEEMALFFHNIFSQLALDNTLELFQDSSMEEFMTLAIARGGIYSYYAGAAGVLTRDEEVRKRLAEKKEMEIYSPDDKFWWWRTPSMIMLLDTYCIYASD